MTLLCLTCTQISLVKRPYQNPHAVDNTPERGNAAAGYGGRGAVSACRCGQAAGGNSSLLHLLDGALVSFLQPS